MADTTSRSRETLANEYIPPILRRNPSVRIRRRVALWIMLILILVAFGTYFAFDDKTFALVSLMVAFIPSIVALIPEAPQLETPKELPKQDPQREALLYKVYKTWIEGVLHANLPTGSIDIGIGLQPEAVVRHSDYSEYVLPDSSRDINRIFTDMHGELLILGEPGSGKTILMLQLAQQLLGRAQADATYPLPFVLNLSSWGKDRKPLAEWLVDEFIRSYDMDKKDAKRLIEEGRLTLLLDGLDEIAPSDTMTPGSSSANLQEGEIALRSKCIDAINTYCKAHAEVDMVVCSRVRDYQALTNQLDLNAAILLQPLTDAQIEAYLGGDEYDGICDLLKQEGGVDRWSKSPLLLTLMKFAYAGIPYSGSPHHRLKLITSDPAARQTHLLRTYIEKILVAHPSERYTLTETHNYLDWLAWQMRQHKLSLFYIESLQPDWTRNSRKYRALTMRIVGLIGGVIIGLLGGLLFGLIGGVIIGLIGGLLFGLSGGMIFGLLVGRSDEIDLKERITLSLSYQNIRSGLLVGLLVGLIGGLLVGLLDGLLFGLLIGLSNGLIGGLLFGLFFGLFAVLGALNSKSNPNLRLQAGDGVKNSLQNALWVGLIVGLLVGLLGGLLGGLGGGLSRGLGRGLLGGVGGGLIAGLLVGGGNAVLQHIILRFQLSAEGVIPGWRYDRFLDECAQMGLLRKVGAGYIFRHRILLEYFAQEYEETQKVTKAP